MVRRIHHVNFIVRDLDAAVALYERVLGMPVTRRDELPERGARAARFRVGESWIVLVQPTRPDGVPARYLAEHGEGFFLLSLETTSLDDALDALGAQMADGPSRRGADNWRVQDLRRERTFGAQLQFCVEERPLRS